MVIKWLNTFYKCVSLKFCITVLGKFVHTVTDLHARDGATDLFSH